MRFRGWLHVVAIGCLAATISASQLAKPPAHRRRQEAGCRGSPHATQTKANINATEADGFTALHWAAQRNDLALVDLLLGAGANARASTRYNITPLYLAAVNGNAAIMERLLKAGADPNATARRVRRC